MKGTDLNKIFVGLDRIIAGEFWAPQNVLKALLAARPPQSSSRYHLGLSPREWEVANCLTRGLQDKSIAKELNLSPHYVRQVTKQIYDKLGVRTRMQAAMRVRVAMDADSGLSRIA